MAKADVRAVLDTNVLISAALALRGKPRRAFDWVIDRGVMLASEPTFDEFVTRIRRPKFSRWLDAGDREEYIDRVYAWAEFVEISEHIQECRDPDDDKFLEVAVNGNADVIISGDKDLKVLHPFRDIPILTPAEFLESEFVRG